MTQVIEWMDTFQYSLKLRSSQDEEMSLIGALLYGSLFLFCKDLLKHILSHPIWIKTNKDHAKPIIIDLVVKPFRGSSKSVEMIFIWAERSKKDDAK
jgi:hypothetical protein